MRSNTATRTLDPAATRAAIVETATRLFAEKGFSATSTAEIAEGAGVTKSLVLYHFSTKEALWREVINTKTCPIHELAAKFLNDEEGLSASDFIKAKFDTLRSDPDLPRFVAWMSLEPSLTTPDMRERAAGVREKMASDPAKYGFPEGVDPFVFMVVVMSAVDGYFRFRQFYNVMLGRDVVTPEAEAAFFDVLMKLAFPAGGTNGVQPS